MRTDFTLQRVCGTTYRRGNLLFADSGMTLCVPTGNQLSEHNVVSGVVRTYASSTLNDIACFDLSREGTLMVCVDIKGFGYFINRRVDIALERVPFPRTTTCVKFSHNGMYVAVGSYGELQIWTTPIDGVLQYRSVRMITRYTHVLQGDIATLEWAQDDSHILVCGTDATIRILPRRRVWEANTRMHLIATLVAQKTPVIASFFSTDINDEIIGVSVDRCLVTWKQNAEILRHDLLSEKWRLVHQEISDDEDDTLGDETQKKRLKTEARTEANYEALVGNQEDVDLASLRLSAYHWDISQKEYISSNSRISSVAYNQQKKIIVCGMADGSFIISHLEPKLVMLHTLSITAQQVSSVAISPTGDWVAFGSTKLHQLMVWDWAAESYVLRHQAHASDINAVCYSSNGLYLISVGEDGKMKVWSTKTGQCVATFKDHEGAIVSVVPNTGNAVFTASADGTLRGYDLQSMKLFRLMKPNESIQLACISLDPSGELIAAGTIASGRIYLFSTQTGRLVDEFTGHTACVAALDFHPLGTLLSSVSWDETCRIYDIFGTDDSSGKRLRSSVEVVGMGSMGLCTRFSPNGNMLAVLSYASEVTLYDVSRGELAVLTSWNVERDSRGGYNCLHNNNPKSRNCRRPFTTMAFSPDGTSLILAGDSKWICMYSVRGGFLLRKWSVTTNHSVEGNVEQYNWRAFNSEIGSTQTIDDDDSDVEDRFRKLIKLPGVAKGEHAVGKRAKTLVSRTKWLTFAQNGREWVAASSIGLCVYSLDTGRNSLLFIPHHFVAGVTPKRVQQHLTNGSYYSALIGALSLSIPELIDKVISTIPLQRAQEVIAVVPVPLLMALMEAVARILNRGLLWELSSQWCHEILLHHGQYFKSSILNVRGMPVSENTMKVEDGTIAHLRLLLQAQSTHSEIINHMNENRYTVDYWAKLLAK